MPPLAAPCANALPPPSSGFMPCLCLESPGLSCLACASLWLCSPVAFSPLSLSPCRLVMTDGPSLRRPPCASMHVPWLLFVVRHVQLVFMFMPPLPHLAVCEPAQPARPRQVVHKYSINQSMICAPPPSSPQTASSNVMRTRSTHALRRSACCCPFACANAHACTGACSTHARASAMHICLTTCLGPHASQRDCPFCPSLRGPKAAPVCTNCAPRTNTTHGRSACPRVIVNDTLQHTTPKKSLVL